MTALSSGAAPLSADSMSEAALRLTAVAEVATSNRTTPSSSMSGFISRAVSICRESTRKRPPPEGVVLLGGSYFHFISLHVTK